MKMKIKRKNLLFGIWMYFLFNTPYCFGYIKNSELLMLLHIGMGLILSFYAFVCLSGNSMSKKYLFIGIKCFAVPFFEVTLFSICTAILVYHLTIKPYITQTIILTFYHWTIILIAFVFSRETGEESMFIILKSAIVSYSTVIIRYIAVAGFEGILHPFNYRVNGVGLEVHGLTYCLAIIFIYFWVTKGYKYIFRHGIFYITVLYIILGNKRALYLGMVVTILLYQLFKIFSNKKEKILGIATGSILILVLIFIYSIRSGLLQMLAVQYNVTDSFRFNFWNYFKSYYEFSPLYLGRTIFFTDYYMTLPEIHKMYNFSGQGQMHNDLLRTFIGWGFIPFIYYYYRFMVSSVKKMKKLGIKHAGWKFYPIICFFVFIEGFDNMLSGFDFNMIFFLIFFLIIRYHDTPLEDSNRNDNL